MFDRFPIETGIEQTATSHANASKGAGVRSVDTGFDTRPVTATVSPAPAPAPAAVETGFGDLNGRGCTTWLEHEIDEPIAKAAEREPKA